MGGALSSLGEVSWREHGAVRTQDWLAGGGGGGQV